MLNLRYEGYRFTVRIILLAREQKKKMARLEMELAAARHVGFVSQHSSKNDAAHSKKKLLAVVGIITTFGHNNNRDAIRKAWMPTGKPSAYSFHMVA